MQQRALNTLYSICNTLKLLNDMEVFDEAAKYQTIKILHMLQQIMVRVMENVLANGFGFACSTFFSPLELFGCNVDFPLMVWFFHNLCILCQKLLVSTG